MEFILPQKMNSKSVASIRSRQAGLASLFSMDSADTEMTLAAWV